MTFEQVLLIGVCVKCSEKDYIGKNCPQDKEAMVVTNRAVKLVINHILREVNNKVAVITKASGSMVASRVSSGAESVETVAIVTSRAYIYNFLCTTYLVLCTGSVC